MSWFYDPFFWEVFITALFVVISKYINPALIAYQDYIVRSHYNINSGPKYYGRGNFYLNSSIVFHVVVWNDEIHIAALLFFTLR